MAAVGGLGQDGRARLAGLREMGVDVIDVDVRAVDDVGQRQPAAGRFASLGMPRRSLVVGTRLGEHDHAVGADLHLGMIFPEPRQYVLDEREPRRRIAPRFAGGEHAELAEAVQEIDGIFCLAKFRHNPVIVAIPHYHLEANKRQG